MCLKLGLDYYRRIHQVHGIMPLALPLFIGSSNISDGQSSDCMSKANASDDRHMIAVMLRVCVYVCMYINIYIYICTMNNMQAFRSRCRTKSSMSLTMAAAMHLRRTSPCFACVRLTVCVCVVVVDHSIRVCLLCVVSLLLCRTPPCAQSEACASGTRGLCPGRFIDHPKYCPNP